jgi:hypothetical protein
MRHKVVLGVRWGRWSSCRWDASGYVVGCNDGVDCVRVCYGMNFVAIVCVMCVVSWAADEDVSMVISYIL